MCSLHQLFLLQNWKFDGFRNHSLKTDGFGWTHRTHTDGATDNTSRKTKKLFSNYHSKCDRLTNKNSLWTPNGSIWVTIKTLSGYENITKFTLSWFQAIHSHTQRMIQQERQKSNWVIIIVNVTDWPTKTACGCQIGTLESQ